MVIQAALLAAVQLQPAATVTGTTPVDAVAPTSTATGEIVGVQLAPDWVSVKVFPAIVIVPVRGVVPGFAATL